MRPAAEHPTVLERLLPDEAATARLAGRLAALARTGDVIALRGDLGSGKTAFARAFINALPGPQEEVPSPTFTLLQVYERGPFLVYHFDFYRLSGPEEAFALGVEEAFAEGVSLIEWPERLEPLLPAERLDLELAFAAGETARRARLSGGLAWSERLERLAA